MPAKKNHCTATRSVSVPAAPAGCRAKIRLKHDLAKCADPGSGRYALGYVRILPKDDSSVFAAATDGRSAVIVEQEGSADAPQFMPLEMAKFKGKAPSDVWLNSHWMNDATRKFAPVEDTPVRFPKLSAVFPNSLTEQEGVEYVPLALDASILENLSTALKDRSGETQGVVLMVPVKREEEKPLEFTKGAIFAISNGAERSVGAIMPMTFEGRNESYEDACRKLYERYASVVADYAAAEAASSEPAPESAA